MNDPHTNSGPLFVSLPGAVPASKALEIPKDPHDVSACSTPESILSMIGALLPLLDVSPSRKVQALMLLNPNMDRPSFRGLANLLGKNLQHLHYVVTGRRDSSALKLLMAGELCVTVESIWPPSQESGPAGHPAQAHVQEPPKTVHGISGQ